MITYNIVKEDGFQNFQKNDNVINVQPLSIRLAGVMMSSSLALDTAFDRALSALAKRSVVRILFRIFFVQLEYTHYLFTNMNNCDKINLPLIYFNEK